MDCVESTSKENCGKTFNSSSQPLGELSFEKVALLLDEACSRIAKHYDLFYSNGKPRRALIIEIIAKTTCTSCIDRLLRTKSFNSIDNFYTECHMLACNILVEELQVQLTERGYSVLVTNEKMLVYGKVDILIIPNRHGLDLRLPNKEVGIEVKTGVSLSFSQLFRYMLDNVGRTVLLWRIRNKQVLFFEGNELKPLLTQFMKMIISRAERLLSNNETLCEHVGESKNWSPTQRQLQEAFSDFSKGLIKTLPSIVEAVVTTLEREVN